MRGRYILKIHPNTKLLCQRVIFEFAVNWAAGQGKGLLAVELERLARPRRRTLDSLSPGIGATPIRERVFEILKLDGTLNGTIIGL
jgi:hypothetical protein